MELRHLRYFVALAEELHFGRAAVKLGISQPPLSQQIRALEHELATRLFDRTNRSVALTEAGRLFLGEARLALAQAERARIVASRAQLGELGEITVGMFPSAPLAAPIAEMILTFRRSYPSVRLILRETAIHPALRDLAEDRLELCFLRYPVSPPVPIGFKLMEVIREPLMVVVNAGHRLAQGDEPLPLSALAGEPMIHFPPGEGSAMNEQVTGLCRAAGFEPRIEQEANQNGTILALIAAGLGVSVLPHSFCRLRMPELHVRPLADTGATSAGWLAYRDRTPLARNLVRIMRSMARRGGTAPAPEPPEVGIGAV